jgi:hypothetical protein
MKKLLLLAILCLLGCVDRPEIREETNTGFAPGESISIKTVKDARENSHEYIFYVRSSGGSMTHYPDCKFCKEKNR